MKTNASWSCSRRVTTARPGHAVILSSRVGAIPAMVPRTLDGGARVFVSPSMPTLARRIFRILTLLALVLGALAGALGYFARGPFVRVRTRAAPEELVSPERLRATVETLAVELQDRWVTHPEVLAEAADWLLARFAAAGLATGAHTYDTMEGTFRNVLGTRPGRDPTLAPLIVGAHYDSYGEMPGADDNASGVAALCELARLLPADPVRTVVLVGFVNEEPPFFASDDMGSLRYAASLDAVDLMISFEMLGYYSDEPGSQSYPLGIFRLYYPNRGNFVAIVGDSGMGGDIARTKRAFAASTELPVYSFRGPRSIAGVDWSDHRSFRQHDFPALMITDTAFLRNPNYHTSRDTPDTLDYGRLAQAVTGVLGVIRDRAY